MVTLLKAAGGRSETFHTRIVAEGTIGNVNEKFMLDVLKDGTDYDIRLTHRQYSLQLRRRSSGTALALPNHQVAFVATGEIDLTTGDNLDPNSLAARLISSESAQGQIAPLLFAFEPAHVLNLAKTSMGAKVDPATGILSIGGMEIRSPQPDQIQTSLSGMKVRAGVSELKEPLLPHDQWPDYRIENVDRQQLEQTIARAVRRATEILMPGESLTAAGAAQIQAENGESRNIEGHRVILLRGTHQQIGQAHGKVLQYETARTIDSVIHVYGLLQTLATGKWFPSELEKRFKELEAHIPPEYIEEQRQLAQSIGQPAQVIHGLNLCLEQIHSGGFAAFNSATSNGQLLHAGMLEGLANMALLDVTVSFIISVEGKTPFASVGYAGFTGCISGMNLSQIAISKTSDFHTGQATGIPMSILARMALEKCDSLESAVQLIQQSPRSGQGVFLITDGTANLASAVLSSAEITKVVDAATGHPRLGDTIKDCVVTPCLNQIAELPKALTSKLSSLDAESAIGWLPELATKESPLQNVVLSPASGLLHVSNTYRLPSGEQPVVVKLDIKELAESPLTPVPPQ
ncbi:MAG TPA: hypothetical protein DCF63_19220 [Planctomycetaceae bacterium]|nr:hypothetical protein [Planctomycetaceae bacterium]